MTANASGNDAKLREYGDLRRRGRKAGDSYTGEQKEARREFAKHYDRAVGELLRRHGWTKKRTGSHGEWYLERSTGAHRRAVGIHITPADWILTVAFKVVSGQEESVLRELRAKYSGLVSRVDSAHALRVAIALDELLEGKPDFESREEAITAHILDVVTRAH